MLSQVLAALGRGSLACSPTPKHGYGSEISTRDVEARSQKRLVTARLLLEFQHLSDITTRVPFPSSSLEMLTESDIDICDMPGTRRFGGADDICKSIMHWLQVSSRDPTVLITCRRKIRKLKDLHLSSISASVTTCTVCR